MARAIARLRLRAARLPCPCWSANRAAHTVCGRCPSPTLFQGRSPPCACWSANRAACILWGRCPLFTGASARLYLWAAAHHSPVGLPTGLHTLSRAAAPSLPGPLPHHYQGRSPPCSRWSANRAAHSLWGRCPNITRAPARLYLRAAAHHAPVGSPAGMHALSWTTAHHC